MNNRISRLLVTSLFSTSLIFSFTSCQNENTENARPSNMELASANAFQGAIKDGDSYTTPDGLARPIFRFTHGGLLGQQGCRGGICGICIGICIKFGSSVSDVLPAYMVEEEHTNFADLEFSGDQSKLIMRPYTSADNGDGSTRIEEDYDLGPEVAEYLGLTKVVIKAGQYDISYSDEYPMGVIAFDYYSE